MARALLDINIFSEEWFAPVLADLLAAKNVVFVYGMSSQFTREIGRARKALEFYQRVGQMRTSGGDKRRLDVAGGEIDGHIDFLQGQQCFAENGDCDDPHIFSVIYAKPTRFVFSMDMRLARCRTYINQFVDNRYCDFIVIGGADVYRRHRQAIAA